MGLHQGVPLTKNNIRREVKKMEGKNARGKEKREMLKRQKVRRVHQDVFDSGLKNYLLTILRALYKSMKKNDNGFQIMFKTMSGLAHIYLLESIQRAGAASHPLKNSANRIPSSAKTSIGLPYRFCDILGGVN